MSRFIVAIAANALGIYLATRIVYGFEFTGTYLEFAIAAVLFTLINWLIRPVVKFVSGPLIFVTLGLFTIVVNMVMLWLLDLVIPTLSILSFTALLLATVIIGITNLLLHPFKNKG